MLSKNAQKPTVGFFFPPTRLLNRSRAILPYPSDRSQGENEEMEGKQNSSLYVINLLDQNHAPLWHGSSPGPDHLF